MTDLRFLEVNYETAPTDGQSLVYDAATGLWVPSQNILTGWKEVTETWTYASANTVTVATDATTRFKKKWRVRWKQGGAYKYGVIYNVTATVISITGGTDYTVANSAITNVAVSREVCPEGFPGFFNWTPTITGSGGMTISATSIQQARHRINIDFSCDIDLSFTCTTGTSDSNALLASFPLGVTPAYTNQVQGCTTYPGAGAYQAGFVFIDTAPRFSFYKYDASNLGLGTLRQAIWKGDFETT